MANQTSCALSDPDPGLAGVAVLTQRVPLDAAGRTYLYQVVETSDCTKSGIVEYTWQ